VQNSRGSDTNEWPTSRLATQWGFLRFFGLVLTTDILQWSLTSLGPHSKHFTLPVAVNSVSRLSLCLQASLYVSDYHSLLKFPSPICRFLGWSTSTLVVMSIVISNPQIYLWASQRTNPVDMSSISDLQINTDSASISHIFSMLDIRHSLVQPISFQSIGIKALNNPTVMTLNYWLTF